MSFPLSKTGSVPHGEPIRGAAPCPAYVQEDTLRNYGCMREFTRYAVIHSTQHSLGYQLEQLPIDATVRWQDIAPVRERTPTFADRVASATAELPAGESTEAGRRFLLDFLQTCRERKAPLDLAAQAAARLDRTVGNMRAGIHSPSAERSSAFVDVLLASVRRQGQALSLGDPGFPAALASCLPHMQRILETLAWRGVVPSALDWQIADYVVRLARVSRIVEARQLAGAEDLCRLFIEPEPNATVAQQQRDWDQRLAKLPHATDAQWRLRQRAAAALAPLLNPQVAQHLLTALQGYQR